jgi:hypothetical protein
MSKRSTCGAITLVGAVWAGTAGAEPCKVSETVSAANTSYVQQHAIEVGDVPRHFVRVAEIKRTYPDDKPNCEGLKRTYALSELVSDYVDQNGPLQGYAVVFYENGDKMFQQWSGVSQTTVDEGGNKRSQYTGVVRITGGTGVYANARGVFRETAVFDASKGYNELRREGEYSVEK